MFCVVYGYEKYKKKISCNVFENKFIIFENINECYKC